MTDLSPWLHAQLDRATEDANQDHTLNCRWWDEPACTCPVRHRIADIVAKRAILDMHWVSMTPEEDGYKPFPICRGCGHQAPCMTVRLLASAYAHRPGYRKEWACN